MILWDLIFDYFIFKNDKEPFIAILKNISGLNVLKIFLSLIIIYVITCYYINYNSSIVFMLIFITYFRLKIM
jgi:hypothetical protein